MIVSLLTSKLFKKYGIKLLIALAEVLVQHTDNKLDDKVVNSIKKAFTGI